MKEAQSFVVVFSAVCALVCIGKSVYELDFAKLYDDEPSRIRPFWWLIISAAFMGTCNSVTAQKILWRVEITTNGDTVAVGPAGDIDSAFVRWSLRGKDLRDCKFDLYMRDKEITSLYSERDKCMKSEEGARKVMDAMRETQESLIARNDKLARKVKRRQPWIWMAVGAGGMLLLQNQLSR